MVERSIQIFIELIKLQTISIFFPKPRFKRLQKWRHDTYRASVDLVKSVDSFTSARRLFGTSVGRRHRTSNVASSCRLVDVGFRRPGVGFRRPARRHASAISTTSRTSAGRPYDVMKRTSAFDKFGMVEQVPSTSEFWRVAMIQFNRPNITLCSWSAVTTYLSCIVSEIFNVE